MLPTTRLVNETSVERLTKLWAARYVPDLSTFSSQADCFTVSDLLQAASPEGRDKTVAKVQRSLQINCEFAEIKMNALFSYIPNIVNLIESGHIAEYAALVYERVLSIYKEQSPPNGSLPAMPQTAALNLFGEAFDSSSNVFTEWVMPALELPAVEQLASSLDPVLLQLRKQHLLAQDPRSTGFTSTQFHFSTKLILHKLTIPEQVLLSPYFKFVEEQISIPWQRVCNAAAQHELDSPALTAVEQLLAASHEIASAVYHRAAQLYPNHHSRRGGLFNPDVKISSIRDLEMFQGYLCLCVLERSMKVMEQELLPLCVMVFPSVDVRWELVQNMLSLLADELMERLNPEQKMLLLPYTQAMQQLFSNLEAKAAC